MIPAKPDQNKNEFQKANQQFLDSNGKIVAECETNSVSIYHPAHKHFHISDVALFEVRIGSSTGVLFSVIRLQRLHLV